MSTSKRASTLPKPPTCLASNIVISDTASLTGSHRITICGNSIIHPRAKIISIHAPVTIGSSCMLSERSRTGLQSAAENQSEGVVVEDGVIIEVGAVVEGRSVGTGSLIEVNAKIGRGAVIGKHCKIGPFCTVEEDAVVPDYTVIYGTGMRRIDSSAIENMKMRMVGRQAEVLRRLVPSNVAKYQS